MNISENGADQMKSKIGSCTNSLTSCASKVFGDLVVDDSDMYSVHTVHSTNSLCYSPSPLSRNQNIGNMQDNFRHIPTPRIFCFDGMEVNSPAGKNDTAQKKLAKKGTKKYNAMKENEIPYAKQKKTTKIKHFEVPRSPFSKKNMTASLNQSLNAARRSKKVTLNNRKKQIERMKNIRLQEKKEAQEFYAEAKKTKIELLDLKSQLSSQFRRAKVERMQNEEKARLGEVEKESLFKSAVFRDHKKQLKKIEDQRRRASIEVRKKLRAENQAGEQKLRMARIGEDKVLIEERHQFSLAVNENKRMNAECRRKSLVFRNGTAKRIHQLHAELELKRTHIEHESYVLKWAGEKDAEAYKKDMAQERRASLAFRNEEGRRLREVEDSFGLKQQYDEHTSNELKWAGERDAEEYKKQMAQERRDSFAFRNEESRRMREAQDHFRSKQHHEEHESHELKRAGEKDAEAYKKQMVEERRNSFAFRNEEGRRMREVEEHLRSKQQHDEHESHELRLAGEKDAEAYKKDMARERRDSFAFRNEEGRRVREVEEHLRSKEQHDEHESFELKQAGEKDAEDYKNEMAQERRDSLAFRNEEGRRVRGVEDRLRSKRQHDKHESYELKWSGEKDAEVYKKEMADERRDSFAFRNEEGRRMREVEEHLTSKELQEEHESHGLKWAGEKDAEAYKKQMAQERRDSFAFRNEEGRRMRDFDDCVRSKQQQEEHESHELKLAGEKDAEAYNKEMAEERRDSFAFRNKEGRRVREVEDYLRSKQQQEEHESHELKWAGEKDAEAYKKQMAEERRDSFVFRNEEGRRMREVEEHLRSKQRHDEHESHELKWAGEKDAEAYKKEMAQERRDSFAFRNEEGRRVREVESQLKADQGSNEHGSYKLKWAGEKDAEAYKKQIAQERRDSCSLRNKEGKHQREVEEQFNTKERIKEHESYELKWAGEKDAEIYHLKLSDERRKSFVSRNVEHSRHRAVMKELSDITKEKENELLLLKWAAQDDVKEYFEDEAECRRKSIAFRNEEGRRHRKMDKENHQERVLVAAVEEQLQTLCQHDVREYVEACKERDRSSLCLRGTEIQIQRLEEEERHLELKEKETVNRELELGARTDVQEYVKTCKNRNRLSLVFRAKEKRCHEKWQRKQQKIEADQKRLEYRDIAWDRRYVALAKEKERTLKAIDEMRHNGCSFAGNPFLSLLD